MRVLGFDGLNGQALRYGSLYQVGKQQFTVRRGCETFKVLPEPIRAEAVEAAVNLTYRERVSVGVALFDNRRYFAAFVSYHAPHALRLRAARCDDSGAGFTVVVPLRQAIKGCREDERSVPV